MKSIGPLHKVEAEILHRELLLFHGDLAWKAAKRIEKALEALHQLERRSLDDRSEARARIKLFEALRDRVESLWQDAGQLSDRLIDADGCDGSCKR